MARDDDEAWIDQLYRGLTQRSDMWRRRVDVTIAWAAPLLVATATFALGSADVPHLLLLLFGLVVLGIALFVEGHRYRRLHHAVWRVYLIEVGHFVARLSGSPSGDWRALLAQDLYRPQVLISLPAAMMTRLRTTYLIFVYLLAIAWVTKVVIHPTPTSSIGTLVERMGIGVVPGWAVAAAVALFVAALTVAAIRTSSTQALESWATDPAFRHYDRELAHRAPIEVERLEPPAPPVH